MSSKQLFEENPNKVVSEVQSESTNVVREFMQELERRVSVRDKARREKRGFVLRSKANESANESVNVEFYGKNRTLASPGSNCDVVEVVSMVIEGIEAGARTSVSASVNVSVGESAN